MTDNPLAKFGTYSPVGDILTIIICLLLILLLFQTFITRDNTFRAFSYMLVLVTLAGFSHLLMNVFLADYISVPKIAVYICREICHVSLFGILALYVYYLVHLIELPEKKAKKYYIVSSALFAFLILTDIISTATGYGFIIHEDGSYDSGYNFFGIAFGIFVAVIFYMLIKYRRHIVSQIQQGIMGSFVLYLLVQFIQGRFHQTSFTTALFLIPVIALMYLLHSAPYDNATGAINAAYFFKLVEDSYKKNKDLMIVVLNIRDFEKNTHLLKDMHTDIYRFYNKVLRKANLFRLSGGRLVLVYKIDDNPDYEDTNRRLIEAFTPLYEKLKLNFKVLFIKSVPEISKTNQYMELADFVDPRCGVNQFYTVNEDDILNFSRRLYIISQLEDIAEKMDLDDPRVLVYCQPVFNVSSGLYDTAEALMRMELPDTGFLFPDTFIPIAEQTDLIHPLSLIILNKTCKIINHMLSSGFHVHRISINFSIQEVRDNSFCSDILRIIEMNEIPYEKVAIELTESRNTTDFNMVKDRINELKEKGITFYLDDFGTGYSNFDRIMELPFDIIKFDRSLVIESGKDKTSEYMVHTFADMFHKLNYKVLYEGVEDTTDEARCIRMFAQYLQGYKYSKPIPISQLESFFSRAM